jgi:hypothetical protein
MSLMTAGETECIERNVGLVKSYLEWGADASTVFAATQSNISRIFSVESSEEFFNSSVLSDAGVRNALASDRLEYRVVNIGKCKEWGIPVNADNSHFWPNYALCPFVNKNAHYELALIDGRFRVACGLACFLSGQVDKVLIHDYSNRKEYHVLERFAVVEERIDRLVVLRKRSDALVSSMQKLLQIYNQMPNDVVFNPTFPNKLAFRVKRLLIN